MAHVHLLRQFGCCRHCDGVQARHSVSQVGRGESQLMDRADGAMLHTPLSLFLGSCSVLILLQRFDLGPRGGKEAVRSRGHSARPKRNRREEELNPLARRMSLDAVIAGFLRCTG